MKSLTAGLFGLIFGLGLVISGMTDPNRILAFLDVAGDWDPSLALVMVAAIAVASPAYAFGRRKRTTAFGEVIHLPDRSKPITPSLLLGAAIFGVGWGLSGLCPAPAIVLLSTGQLKAFSFISAVATGIWATTLISTKNPKVSAAQPRKPAEPIPQAVNAQKANLELVSSRKMPEQEA